MRKTLFVIGVVAGVALAAAVAALVYLRSGVPEYDGDVVVRGLSAPVEVWRDSLAVPHIWAETETETKAARIETTTELRVFLDIVSLPENPGILSQDLPRPRVLHIMRVS